VVAAGVVVVVLLALGVGGAVVIGVALMATSLGLVVPVLADSGALNRPIGRVAIAGASAGEVAAVVLLSVGLSGGDTPLAGRILLLVLLLAGLVVIGLAVAGVEHSMRLSAMFVRLADTSAQIRVRWTVLLVAGLALAAQVLRGLMDPPGALATVPAFLLALLFVRGLPAVAFHGEIGRREVLALGLLQATSLPFLIAATAIGREMGVLDPAVGAGLVAAGLVSVLVFPAVVLALLPRQAAVSVAA
jgi:Kef-type K+ transport system membrane component KefB